MGSKTGEDSYCFPSPQIPETLTVGKWPSLALHTLQVTGVWWDFLPSLDCPLLDQRIQDRREARGSGVQISATQEGKDVKSEASKEPKVSAADPCSVSQMCCSRLFSGTGAGHLLI